MSITIYDIAKELKISPSTVSRVLNNSLLISDETSIKIHETAKSLGYKPRIIKKQQNRVILTIKLVTGPKNDHLLPIFYDFTDLIKGIKTGSENSKLNLAVEINDADLNLFENKKGGNVDGVIFAFTKPSDAVYAELGMRKIPNITINRSLKKEDFINCNNSIGLKELIVQLKRKRKDPRICYLFLAPHNDVSKGRLECLKIITKEEGLNFTTEDAIAIKDTDKINGDLFKSIKKKYNSIVAMNDVLAITVLARASSFGFQIPNDFSLTGFDNSPVRSLFLQKVDTISLPVKEIGIKTGEWIQNRILHKSQVPFQIEIPGTYQMGDTI